MGRPKSAETKEKMSDAHKGKTHSIEILAKISAKTREGMTDPALRAKMSEAKKGKTLSEITKAKLNKKVFVYSLDPETKVTILYKQFNSCTEVTEFFDCSTRTVSYYLDKNKLYKKQWNLSSTMKEESKE
jgi:hypothetical protein